MELHMKSFNRALIPQKKETDPLLNHRFVMWVITPLTAAAHFKTGWKEIFFAQSGLSWWPNILFYPIWERIDNFHIKNWFKKLLEMVYKTLVFIQKKYIKRRPSREM